MPATDSVPIGKIALVGEQHRVRGHAQEHGIDGRGAERQVGMGTASRTDRLRGRMFVAVVWTRSPLLRQRVLDAEREREGIAGLVVDRVLHHDAVLLARGDRPGCPAHEAMNGVVVLRLGQGELVPPPVELVAPVLQPVRPWGQHLAAPGGARRVERVAVEEIPAACRVRAEAAADLDHHGPLVGVDELELLTRGWLSVRARRQRSRASR